MAKENLLDFFESMPDAQVAVKCETTNVFLVSWARKGIGFGEITLYFKDNKLHIESERMNPKFVKGILSALVDDCAKDGRFE